MVDRAPMIVSSEQLVDELSRLLGDTLPEHAVIAFDGDGTLWSGDVGEDLFRAAMNERYLVENARSALLAEAERHGLCFDAGLDANAIASGLFAAYQAGRYPERETCAMMTWCYAGRRAAEVTALATSVLEEQNLASRLNPELAPVIAWGRARGVRLVLVSASPRAIVEPAGAFWGFAPMDIAASTPALEGERVVPRLANPVPYAEAKVSAGRALFGQARWLAAFGDNVFDIEMLKTAELGFAVRPKPKLATEIRALGLRQLAR